MLIDAAWQKRKCQKCCSRPDVIRCTDGLMMPKRLYPTPNDQMHWRLCCWCQRCCTRPRTIKCAEALMPKMLHPTLIRSDALARLSVDAQNAKVSINWRVDRDADREIHNEPLRPLVQAVEQSLCYEYFIMLLNPNLSSSQDTSKLTNLTNCNEFGVILCGFRISHKIFSPKRNFEALVTRTLQKNGRCEKKIWFWPRSLVSNMMTQTEKTDLTFSRWLDYRKKKNNEMIWLAWKAINFDVESTA